jgi:hypothetical protein
MGMADLTTVDKIGSYISISILEMEVRGFLTWRREESG